MAKIFTAVVDLLSTLLLTELWCTVYEHHISLTCVVVNRSVHRPPEVPAGKVHKGNRLRHIPARVRGVPERILQRLYVDQQHHDRLLHRPHQVPAWQVYCYIRFCHRSAQVRVLCNRVFQKCYVAEQHMCWGCLAPRYAITLILVRKHGFHNLQRCPNGLISISTKPDLFVRTHIVTC